MSLLKIELKINGSHPTRFSYELREIKGADK